jgi:hypothetical protein
MYHYAYLPIWRIFSQALFLMQGKKTEKTEDIGTIIPALGYVMRVVNGYCAGNAWHGMMISPG